MPSTPRILERLPSVYRPEPGFDDGDPLLELVTAVGSLLDELSASSAEVMQSHWFNYADSAIYSGWLGRRRSLNGEGPLAMHDPVIDLFPYLFDLPRIAALVDLAPWREPLRDRERVEAFRGRMRRIVRLHRNGLGTLAALRTMTLAALPQVDPNAAPGLRERSFTVEEFSGVQRQLQAVSQQGLPGDRVGPLMRWSLSAESLEPVFPMVVIEGVTPQPDQVDPTADPIIERFDPASGTGVGIHYQGILAAGEALALVPGYASWLGRSDGVDRAESVPVDTEPVNPTAPGPWAADASAPVDAVVALVQTEDLSLWAAVNGADGSLWRRDESGWTAILSGLPAIHCLLGRGNQLLIGFASGLSRLEIRPVGPFNLNPDPAGLSDPAVHALALDGDATLWAATARGLAREEAGILVYTDLGTRVETHTELRCLWLDAGGDIYCGGELGLFLHRRARDRWYILQGEAVDEAVADWTELDLAGGTLPAPETIFVPPVNAVVHGPDSHVWMATDRGIARYRAREQSRTYTTLLEAFPRLTQTTAHQIAVDARNRLWFATDEGLFLFDQLDWFQRQGDSLTRLPRHIEDPQSPVFWRFVRGSDNWQWLAPPTLSGFQDFAADPLGSAEPALLCITWSSRAHARLGSFDGSHFQVDAGAIPAPLGVRYKPESTRVVDGGLVGMPPLLAGTSHWRYLQREEPAPPAPSATPAWTREGRLMPPPDSSKAPFEGRYLGGAPGRDTAVFAFHPAARVWFSWRPRQPLAVTVRLARHSPDEQIDPQILDRVWTELQRVKPAAVAVYLGVDETIERGN